MHSVLRLFVGLGLSISFTNTSVAMLPPHVNACLTGLRGIPPTNIDPAQYVLAPGRRVTVRLHTFVDDVLKSKLDHEIENAGESLRGGQKCFILRHRNSGGQSWESAFAFGPGNETLAYVERTHGLGFWTVILQPAIKDGVHWTSQGTALADDRTTMHTAPDSDKHHTWIWVGPFRCPVTGKSYQDVLAQLTVTSDYQHVKFLAPGLGLVYAAQVSNRQTERFRSEEWLK